MACTADGTLWSTKMTNCLLIPVHPAKSNWLISFLNSIRTDCNSPKPGFCVVLATTNHSEYRFFNRLRPLMPLKLDIRLICVDDYIRDRLKSPEVQDHFRKNERNGLVNTKKFVGLHWCLYQGFELIGSIDSDVLMLSSADKLFEIIAENYDKNAYFGASTSETILNVSWTHSSRQRDKWKLRSLQARISLERKESHDEEIPPQSLCGI